jgi:prevent-host-death family protein
MTNMAQFNIAEAKARFSELVERALAGDDVVVARDNKPLLKLVPLSGSAQVRKPGSARGKIRIAGDFDDPVPGFEQYR